MTELKDVIDIDLSSVKKESVETGKTLKDLRNEVKELRKQLEDTEVGTDEFAKALEELTVAQQELTNVTKSGIKAQEGSYNDLVNKMALLKKEWRATADESKRAAIGDKIGEINSQLKSLDSTIGNHQRNVGNYIDKVEVLGESFNNTDVATRSYTETAESCVRVSAGLAGAFAAVQGAMNLMGVESEETTKIILKMQNVMAITEGLENVAESIKHFNILKESVSKFGKVVGGAKGGVIGMFLGGLIAIVAYSSKIEKFFRELSGGIDDTNKKLIETNKLIGENSVEAITKDVSSFRLLTNAYKNLKDELSKTKFIEENKSAFDELGVSINNINDADNIFIKNTKKYVDALISRAKAAGTEELIRSKTSEWAAEQIKLEEELAKARDNRDKRLVDLNVWENTGMNILSAGIDPMGINNPSSQLTEGWVTAKLDKQVKEVEKQIEESNKKLDDDLKFLGGLNEKFKNEYQGLLDISETSETVTEITNTLTDTTNTLTDTTTTLIDTTSEYTRIVLDNTYKSVDLLGLKMDDVSTRLQKLNYEYQKTLSNIFLGYEAEYESNSRRGNELGMAEADLQLLQRQMTAAQNYKSGLGLELANAEFGSPEYQSIIDEIEYASGELKIIAEKIITAANLVTSMKVQAITEIMDSVQNSFDNMLSLSLGDGDNEFSAIFSSVKSGISQVSEELKKGEKGWSKYAGIASLGLNTVAGTLSSISDMQDTQTEEGFERQKNLQIASASMAMLGGVINAVESSFSKENSWMTIWGQAAAAATTSAMVIATGIMQINEIKKQKLDGSGVSGTSAMPTLTAVNAVVPSGLSTTNIIEGASTEGQVTDTRVYVLESDITDKQNSVRTTVSEATF